VSGNNGDTLRRQVGNDLDGDLQAVAEDEMRRGDVTLRFERLVGTSEPRPQPHDTETGDARLRQVQEPRQNAVSPYELIFSGSQFRSELVTAGAPIGGLRMGTLPNICTGS
jgi:hypothetical protein